VALKYAVMVLEAKKAPPFFVKRSRSIQKIADIAGEFSTQSIAVEASAFTAKTGATMHIGAPTTISTTTKPSE
jgi:hypothetical protein